MNGMPLSEAKFIQCGMTKEKWPFITVELIQGFLDDFSLLDHEYPDEYLECFFKYYEWYWNEVRNLSTIST